MNYSRYALKNNDEIESLLQNKDNIYIVSCNKCFKEFDTYVEPEANKFLEIAMSKGINITGSNSFDFLCNKYITEKEFEKSIPEGTKNIVVISCGLGIQTIASLTKYPVYTASDSLNYIGHHGMSMSNRTCEACNQCYLNLTGGICPITDCTKSLVNGPCGGAKNGMCEIDPKKECAWVKICKRLEKQGRAEEFLNNKVELRDYSKVNYGIVHDYVNKVREARLEGYHGGVHPLERKELTENLAPIKFHDPDVVVIPVSMHSGKPAEPIVKVGDHVNLGQKIAELSGFISCNVHSSISGTVEAIENRPGNKGETLSIVIRSDGKNTVDDSVKPNKPLEELSAEEIVEIVKEKGIAGMGGAGFPSYVKLMPGKEIDTVLVNGSECEPLITADHRALLAYSDDIIYGLKAVMKAVSAPKGIIVIEDNKEDAIEYLQAKVANEENIEVLPVKTKYPQGAEKMIIKRALGRSVPSGKLPADVGAVVCNVSTVKAISDAIKTGMPLIERIVTVSGERIKRPGNYIVKIGTSVSDLIDYCGGIDGDNYMVKMGGPMMGTLLSSVDVPVIKGTNGIIAIEAYHDEDGECIKCGRCMDVCPMELKPLYFAKFVDEKNVQALKDFNIMDCMECGCCDVSCSGHGHLIEKIRAGKALLREAK